MNTMIKKFGVIAVVATLLAVVALVTTTCSGVGPEIPGFIPEPGTGAIKINLNLNHPDQAKTILPDDLIMGNIAVFELRMTPATGLSLKPGFDWAGEVATPTTPVPGLLNIAGANDGLSTDPVSSIEIIVANTAQNYTIHVIAFDDLAKTKPLAFGELTNQQAALNQTKTITIELDAYDSVGTGSFTWDIDVDGIENGVVSIANMTITPISGGGTVTATHNLLGGGGLGWKSAIPLTLNSGYYYVDFAITVSGVAVVFRHILHIYQNMTSHFDYALSDAHFGIVQQAIVVNVISINPIPDIPLVLSGGLEEEDTITLYTTTGSPKTITITVTNSSDDYETVNFYTNGALITTGVTAVDPGNTDASIEITAGTPPFAVERTHQLTIEGIADDVPYSTYIFVKIVDDV
jgi:hypothetical protein